MIVAGHAEFGLGLDLEDTELTQSGNAVTVTSRQSRSSETWLTAAPSGINTTNVKNT